MNYYQFLSAMSVVYVFFATIFLLFCVRELILVVSDAIVKKRHSSRYVVNKNDIMANAMISVLIFFTITVVALLHYLIGLIATLKS